MVVGFLTGLAFAVVAGLAGAPWWAVAAAYCLGGAIGIAGAVFSQIDAPERPTRPALSRS